MKSWRDCYNFIEKQAEAYIAPTVVLRITKLKISTMEQDNGGWVLLIVVFL